MRVAGIVAEYNPFHNGHKYQIERTRKALGEDTAIVCCMSGDFVQRGEAAVYSKFARAEAAVRGGADLVFELPLYWSLSSAEGFARGAVGLLGSLGVVDCLSFGSECGSIAPLEQLARALLDPTLGQAIRNELTTGVSFAAAREKAVSTLVGDTAKLLSSPNNILGAEYIKALYDQGLEMDAMTVRREGASHDGAGDGSIRSGAELRTRIAHGQDIAEFIPAEAAEIYAREERLGRGPVLMDRLEPLLLSRLRMLTDSEFASLPDAGEGLGGKICAAVREEAGWDAILAASKSKRYALSRIRRMCMCACLRIRQGDADGTPPYARVLAANERGRALLREINGKTRIPVVTKPATIRAISRDALAVFEAGASARDLYVLACPAREERRGSTDWRTGPAMI